MNFESDLIFSISQFTNSFRDILDKSMREVGLYSGQVYILVFLWQQDSQTQIELAHKLNVSPPTIHKMVKSLIENGFVESRQCAADARSMRVHLTEKGALIRVPVERQWLQVEEQLTSGFTETEKLIFKQLLDKLKSSLTKPS